MRRLFNKKFTFLSIILSIIISGVISFGLGSFIIYKVAPKQNVINLQLTDDKNLNKLIEVYKTLEYDYFEPVDDYKLIQEGIKGLLYGLDDPHTTYFDAEQAKNFYENLSGEYEGIGASLIVLDGVITIDTPFKDSPAEKAGILPQDQIVEVNRENVVGKDSQETISKIKGPKGTEVELGIKRGNAKDLIYVKVVRDVIPVNTVYSKVYTVNNKKIGYIDITQFGETTYNEFKQHLQELEAGNVKGIVIDVRRNPGGYLAAVSQMLEEFIPKGQNIYGIEEKGNKVFVQSEGVKETKNYPITLLIDEGSASASEILASGLNEALGYELVGTTSYGKGTVQTSKSLSDGSSLKYTIQKWLTPDGNWIHKTGVKPTIEVKQPDYFYSAPVTIENDIKIDSVSEQVGNAQIILNALGYSLRTDGYFDQKTQKAIKEVQSKNNITSDGVLNKETAQKLNKLILEKIRDEKNDLQLQKALEITAKK